MGGLVRGRVSGWVGAGFLFTSFGYAAAAFYRHAVTSTVLQSVLPGEAFLSLCESLPWLVEEAVPGATPEMTTSTASWAKATYNVHHCYQDGWCDFVGRRPLSSNNR